MRPQEDDVSDGAQPTPGWYPDPSTPGQQRYWDGQAWTDHTAPLAQSGGSPSAGPGGPPPAPGQQWSSTTSSFGGGAGEPPQTWLWQSIVATLLCCLPLGVAGIVFAAQAQSAIGTGDLTTARAKADTARKLTLASVGVGLVLVLVYAALAIGGIASSGF
jgi:hypothetical protein